MKADSALLSVSTAILAANRNTPNHLRGRTENSSAFPNVGEPKWQNRCESVLFHPFPKPEIVHVRIACFNDVRPLTARRRGPPTTFLDAFLRVGLAHDSQTFAFLSYSPKGFQRRSVIFWVECPFKADGHAFRMCLRLAGRPQSWQEGSTD